MRLLKQANDHVEIRMYDALGTRTAHAVPPSKHMDQVDRERLELTQRMFENYDDAVGNAKANKSLSAIGIREATKAHRARLADSIKILEVNAKLAVNRAREKRAALYAPPQLDPTDAAGAALDREIRENLMQLSDGQRNAEMSKPRVRDALLRAPFDSIQQQQAKALWQQKVDREHAEAIAQLNDAEEVAQWLVITAGVMQHALDATAKELGDPPATAHDVAQRMRNANVA